MTENSLENLVYDLQFSPTNSIDHIPFLRFGERAFDEITNILSEKAEELRKVNSLSVLFAVCREGCLERFADLFAICDGLVEDSNINVRSYAIVLAIRILDLDARHCLLNKFNDTSHGSEPDEG